MSKRSWTITDKTKIVREYSRAARGEESWAVLKTHGISAAYISKWRKEVRRHEAKKRSRKKLLDRPQETTNGLTERILREQRANERFLAKNKALRDGVKKRDTESPLHTTFTIIDNSSDCLASALVEVLLDHDPQAVMAAVGKRMERANK